MLDTSKWREKKGIIYLTVTSDGTTGKEWIRRLEDKGFHLDYYVESALRFPDFIPTNGVTTEVAVLKDSLFSDKKRDIKEIHTEAKRRNLVTPNAEIACLIREKFSGKEIDAMGLLWIITMHEPLKSYYCGIPCLLSVGSTPWIRATSGNYIGTWPIETGFAFAVNN